MVDLGICDVEARGTSLERLSLKRLAGTQESHALARSARAESIVAGRLTSMLTEHFRRTALVSWTSVLLPTLGESVVEFNSFSFSARAFSRLDPLLRRNEGVAPKPTPVLLDVFGRECDLEHVLGFVHRLKRVTNGTRTRLPVLGVVAAPNFSTAAWTSARENGLYAFNLRQFYGDTALAAMSQAERLLRYATDAVGGFDEDADALSTTLEELRSHPYVNDLRSLGLEVACALLLRSEGWEDVQLGTNVPWQETQRDIDAIGKRRGGQDVVVVECKAEHATKELDRVDVKKFFTETLPAALKARGEVDTCVAELWTTGVVGVEARSMLRTISLSPKITPRLVSRTDVLARIPHSLGRCAKLIETIAVPN
jgi:hypothetical protein